VAFEAEAVAPHILCPTCSQMLPTYASFCGNCGTNLEEDPSKPQLSEDAQRDYENTAAVNARRWGIWREGYAPPRPWWWHYRGRTRTEAADWSRFAKKMNKIAAKRGYKDYTDRFNRDSQFQRRMIAMGRTNKL
jgi:hypothetical protein